MPRIKDNFNPQAIYKQTPSCRLLIANIVKDLIKMDADEEMITPISGGVFVELDAMSGENNGLRIHFEDKDFAYFNSLCELLNVKIGAHNRISIQTNLAPITYQEKGSFFTKSFQSKTSNALVIPHALVSDFLINVCKTWKIADKNIVRDLYCVESGPEKGMNVAKELKIGHRKLFDEFHKHLHFNPHLSSPTTKLKISCIGNFYQQHSSKSDPYELVNAAIHAVHLSQQSTSERAISERKSPMQVQTPEGREAKLLFIDGGDIFAEMAATHLEDEVVVISPDNQYRCGSASLYGNLGSVEEFLCRVTDYSARASEAAHLPPDDPMQILIHNIMMKFEPIPNRTVRLAHNSGVRYMRNTTVPEYIAREDIPSYIQLVYTLLLNAKSQGANAYFEHKREPALVQGVTFRRPDGNLQRINILGMIGLDGREESAFNFSQGETVRQEYFENGIFNEDKAVEYYYQQWTKAFRTMQTMEHKPTKFILNAVGAGAFDPSTNGCQFTQASADGFGRALAEYLNQFNEIEEIPQIVFPFYPPSQADSKQICDKFKSAFFTAAEKLPQSAVLMQILESVKNGQQATPCVLEEENSALQINMN